MGHDGFPGLHSMINACRSSTYSLLASSLVVIMGGGGTFRLGLDFVISDVNRRNQLPVEVNMVDAQMVILVSIIFCV
jgi:hypothetical protein